MTKLSGYSLFPGNNILEKSTKLPSPMSRNNNSRREFSAAESYLVPKHFSFCGPWVCRGVEKKILKREISVASAFSWICRGLKDYGNSREMNDLRSEMGLGRCFLRKICEDRLFKMGRIFPRHIFLSLTPLFSLFTPLLSHFSLFFSHFHLCSLFFTSLSSLISIFSLSRFSLFTLNSHSSFPVS